MSDDRSRTNRQRRPWALRRFSSSLRTFAVVGLAVFLMGLAWHVRSESRYTAEVAVDIAPTVVEIVTESHAQLEPGTGFFSPTEILSQLLNTLDPRTLDSPFIGWQDTVQITVNRSQPTAAVRVLLNVTDASESRAKTIASLLGQQLAHQYTDQARTATDKAHADSQRAVRETHQQLVEARAALEALLEVHFDVLAQTARSIATLPATTVQETPSRPVHLTRQQRSALETRLDDLEGRRDQLLLRLTALHPIVRAVDDQIDAIRSQLVDTNDKSSTSATDAVMQGPGVNTKARRIAIPGDSIPAPSSPPATENQDLVVSPRGPAAGVTLDDLPQVVGPADTVYAENSPDAPVSELPTAAAPNNMPHPSTAALARLADGDALYRQRKADWTAAEAGYQAALTVERAAWRIQQQLLDDPCRVDEPQGHFVGANQPPAVAGVVALALVLGGCAAVAGGWHAPTFTRIDQIEATLGVPVVGVISPIDDRSADHRRPAANRYIGWATLGCELLLAAFLIWFILLAVGDERFVGSLVRDPYAAFVEAIDRLPGLGTHH